MIPREETDGNNNSTSFKPTTMTSSISTTTTSSSWTRLKDPRIVRVSRAFGGKDRHSKVCTVRGLRDRRVRLSVPTAIQLYDLQDRLGLNQPSKVVDWLLNAAKHEIDELPPLQIPQGTLFPHSLIENKSKDNVVISCGETSGGDHATNSNQELSSYNNVSGNDFPSRQNLMMTMSNSSVAYNPFARWDPSSLSLAHNSNLPRSLAQNEDNWHNSNFSQVPLQYQPGIITQSYFPDTGNLPSSQLSTSTPVDLESTTLSVRPISFNINN